MLRLAPALLLVLLVVVAASAPDVRACTCPPSAGIEHVYASAEHVVRVQIRKEVRRVHRMKGVPTLDGSIRVYRAKVKEVFKGCLQRGRVLKLYTATDSSLCGAVLERRGDYVIALRDGDRRAFEIDACDFARPVSSLTPSELDFLSTRYECCDGSCACTGSDPVSCLVDPCDDTEACAEGTCVSNFCGGCRAEFFGFDGQPVCTICQDDFDCGAGQACEEGLCVPAVDCAEDADCAPDAWCRPTEAGGASCAPFVSEGELCLGLVPPWTVERCAPGLACVPPPPPPGAPPLPDVPGVCTLDP